MSLIRLTAMASAIAGCVDASDIEVSPGSVDDSGKADAPTTGGAELKVTVEHTETKRARDIFGLSDSRGENREIWFYDTKDLKLYGAGAILRGRKINNDPDDSTVKLRPFMFEQLATEVRTLSGLKCELDRSLDSQTPSCSVTAEQDKGEIDAVAAGDRTIDKVFSDGQELLLADNGPAVTWDNLVKLGPIAAQVWTIKSKSLPASATAELWDMTDGSQVLELSIKAPIADGDDVLADLAAFVRAHGLDLDAEQNSKTKRALDALAATQH